MSSDAFVQLKTTSKGPSLTINRTVRKDETEPLDVQYEVVRGPDPEPEAPPLTMLQRVVGGITFVVLFGGGMLGLYLAKSAIIDFLYEHQVWERLTGG